MNCRKYSTPKRRIETDVMKMLMSDYEVTLVNDSMQEFYVRFYGPTESESIFPKLRNFAEEKLTKGDDIAPFANGVWKIHVELPDQYPYKSPSIGFMNKIFHPNIDESSGSVCLDVINQLGHLSAATLMRDPKSYDVKVKDYVQRYATKEKADEAGSEEEDEEDEMSDLGSFGMKKTNQLVNSNYEKSSIIIILSFPSTPSCTTTLSLPSPLLSYKLLSIVLYST
ncbi:hypothetical protein PSHT_05042 [Puccinia striiformis]|uniref:UBC core domain-containing protein n=1 Tax=Puccinia striiformis TaxID=27350 RepID=A0A2S4WBF5_9BASI|nr:hypothetical protein PSHT_05042 [Puccinia striiformis]